MELVVDTSGRPMSSSEFRIADAERLDDVRVRQQMVAELLQKESADALLLQLPGNFAWFTSGAMLPTSAAGQPAAALLLLPDSRVVITNNVDSPELFDKDLSGMGFLLKERPWSDSYPQFLADVVRGRNVISDTPMPGTRPLPDEFIKLRSTLSEFDQQRLRKLAAEVSHAVEATARTCTVGETEDEIAGQLAHRLLRHGISPQRLQVFADGRSKHYRRSTPSPLPVHELCSIAVVGSREGLHAAAGRTVCFREPSTSLIAAHEACALVQASALVLTEQGLTAFAVWDKVHRIYEKLGHAEEWQRADQGEVIGYFAAEGRFGPAVSADVSRPFTLETGTAVHWHPSIGPARMSDTLLLTTFGNEILTPPHDWPAIEATVRGQLVRVPGILVRN